MAKMTPMTLILNCDGNLDDLTNGRTTGFTHVQTQIICKKVLVLAVKRFINIIDPQR